MFNVYCPLIQNCEHCQIKNKIPDVKIFNVLVLSKIQIKLFAWLLVYCPPTNEYDDQLNRSFQKRHRSNSPTFLGFFYWVIIIKNCVDAKKPQ